MMNISPKHYVETSFIARTLETELLSRLDLVALQPKTILDIGCGAGDTLLKLSSRYPEAQLIGIDHSERMLQYARERCQTLNIQWACLDAGRLPFEDHSVDMIFSNLLFPWYLDIKKLLTEWFRVLRKEGLLMFTAFGPDTLKELSTHALGLIDMHDLGDLLLNLNYVDPVLDVESFAVRYQDQNKLLFELEHAHMIKAPFLLDPATKELTFEAIHVHAWGRGASNSEYIKIPLSSIQKRIMD